MKVLLIGGGGREHAIAWHLKKDPRVKELFIAPGNAGTASLGTNLPISATDVPALLAWAEKERPDWTFVGPEAPLCLGLADQFLSKGLPVFGPNQKAAQLEASKVLTKRLFWKYHIPTAPGADFTDALAAYAYSQKLGVEKGYPQVIKADGLAAGKGVIIAQNPAEAAAAIYQIMEKRIFGDAGKAVVIEECLTGPEVSFLAITDGNDLQLLPLAQDHKRVGDGDTGPNTGGMGAYAPANFLSDETKHNVVENVLKPILAGLKAEGIDYQGVLYAGLMLTPSGPQMLEINVRLGDPETQAVLPLLETPLIDIAAAVSGRTLGSFPLKFNKLAAVTIVLGAPGYPEDPKLGGTITGPGFTKPVKSPEVTVFHAGTKLVGDKKDKTIVTSGGRVAAVTAWALDFESARKAAYAGIEGIEFPGMIYRKDIGAKANVRG